MIPTLQEIIIIDEILTEATSYGLRIEVRDAAEKIWSENNDDTFTLLDAYHTAFRTLIK